MEENFREGFGSQIIDILKPILYCHLLRSDLLLTLKETLGYSSCIYIPMWYIISGEIGEMV